MRRGQVVWVEWLQKVGDALACVGINKLAECYQCAMDLHFHQDVKEDGLSDVASLQSLRLICLKLVKASEDLSPICH